MRKELWSDKNKRIAVIRTAVCVLAIALLLELFSWAVRPPVERADHSEQFEELYPAVEHYTSGYDLHGTTYVPVNDDPQLGFALPGRKIQSIVLEFEAPLDAPVSGAIYYAVNGEALAAENYIPVYAAQGSEYLTARLPAGTYTHLRFDIDQTFSPKHIFTSTGEPSAVYDRAPFSWHNVLLALIVLLCMWLVCLWCKKALRPMRARWQMRQKRLDHAIEIYCGIGCLCVALLAVALQLNRSSMACYRAILPKNIAAADMLSIGVPRAVRSDEYLVGTAGFFHSMVQGEYSVLALDVSSVSALVSSMFKLINPYYWGQLFLPANFAFSWERFIPSMFSIYVFYRLFHIITKKGTFSLLCSLLLAFSPGVQWWGGGPFNTGLFCGIITLFYDFFEGRTRRGKLLRAWGLVCVLYLVVTQAYPAWWIPYTYLFAAILFTIYLRDKRINFKKSDIPYIAVTVVILLLGVVAYLDQSADAMVEQLETVYPGKRFCVGGDLPSSYWANYLTMPFNTWKHFDVPGTNQSEISQFLHLFPIPTVIFLVNFKEFKKNAIMVGLMIFKVLCSIYMVFGIGEFLAKYTLMSYSNGPRLSMLWGLASFLLLLLECYYIVPVRAEKADWAMWVRFAVVNISVIAFLVWVVKRQTGITSYIGASFGLVAVGLIVLANLLLWGKKKQFLAALSVLTLISGVVVNPFNVGVAAIQNTPLAVKIQEIDAQDPGAWIGLDDLYLPKYTYAQGVDCLNYLSWPPRFDLFEPLDENGENRDVYNRYAHVVIDLVDSNTAFDLVQADYFRLDMNVNDLKKWDVRYIITRDQELPQGSNVRFQLLYHDDLDQVNIYQADYL